MVQGRVVGEDFSEESKEIARLMRGKESLSEGFWVGCVGQGIWDDCSLGKWKMSSSSEAYCVKREHCK